MHEFIEQCYFLSTNKTSNFFSRKNFQKKFGIKFSKNFSRNVKKIKENKKIRGNSWTNNFGKAISKKNSKNSFFEKESKQFFSNYSQFFFRKIFTKIDLLENFSKKLCLTKLYVREKFILQDFWILSFRKLSGPNLTNGSWGLIIFYQYQRY